MKFIALSKALRAQYGKPRPPISRDPFELVLWENVAYMANDERRAQAYALLKKKIGTKPTEILDADPDILVEIGRYGIVPFQTAKKLRYISEIAHFKLKDDLKSIIKGDLKIAMKTMKMFSGLGEPGAQKVLLFARAHKTFSVESNGMRVLHRVGFGDEHKNYTQTYKSVMQAVADQLPTQFDELIEAHQLLRTHGKEICKTSRPLCEICPVAKHCRYAQNAGAIAKAASRS